MIEAISAMHRIQLKGPWEYRPLAAGNTPGEVARGLDPHPLSSPELVDLPAPGTIKFPAPWDAFLSEFHGTVEFRRPFNCPTNLTANERVDLVLDGVGGDADVTINGIHLGAIPAGTSHGSFEITPALRLHNEIRITVTRAQETPDPCGLWGTISLEIRDRNAI